MRQKQPQKTPTTPLGITTQYTYTPYFLKSAATRHQHLGNLKISQQFSHHSTWNNLSPSQKHSDKQTKHPPPYHYNFTPPCTL